MPSTAAIRLEGPPRYFQPICVRTEQGYTFHGWMGYEEVSEEEAMRIFKAAEAARKGECGRYARRWNLTDIRKGA